LCGFWNETFFQIWRMPNWLFQKVEDACIHILQHGKIPQHVAFIMDGNRRYARKLGMHTGHGHVKGFDKLYQVSG
jgi:ditrans,polycis-polyprenyl diphosphate synthase